MNPLLKTELFITLCTPLLAAALIGIARKSERSVSLIASWASVLYLVSGLATIATWAGTVSKPVQWDMALLYESQTYQFGLAWILDLTGSVFLAVTVGLAGIIIKYCRYYLHREEGYARFFATIFLFLFGMNVLILSGSLDVLFAGWEIVGLSSFLLIGFYRKRIAPVRNAVRAYTVYRFCDVGLLLGAWMGHYLWHESQHFLTLQENAGHLINGISPWALFGMSLLILLAASGKSAQFPFCFWLPRAMEGPTPSSAIFYGALSIHAGVFLLMRTYPIWQALIASRIAVGLIGLTSALLGTMASRVQSNIKGQIAYSSIAQVGLMLVELSLGLYWLTLFHFVGNASLRCYQLLVSPSVVAHLLRVQGSAVDKVRFSEWSVERSLPERLRSSIYAIAFSEGYVESMLRTLFWRPAIKWGTHLAVHVPTWFKTAALFIGLALAAFAPLGIGAAALGLLMLAASLAGLTEQNSPIRGWNSAAVSAVLAGVLVVVSVPEAQGDTWLYFAGVVPSWLLGRLALAKLEAEASVYSLSRFHGRANIHPVAVTCLFLAFLGLSGFPITTAFIGEDLLLHHTVEHHPVIAAALAAIFVLNGLALVRIFTRIALGPEQSVSIENKNVA